MKIQVVSAIFASSINGLHINLIRQDNHFYESSMQIGSKFSDVMPIFDTASEWTFFKNESQYNVSESESAIAQFEDGDEMRICYGETNIYGHEYKENLFIDVLNRSNSVPDLDLVVAEEVEGEFKHHGVIGLAPSIDSNSQHSIVDKLYHQGIIPRRTVEINLANNAIELGEAAFDADNKETFENKMVGKWALQIDGMSYGDQNITEGIGAKLAIIDSANATIQVPESVFINLHNQMDIDMPGIFIDAFEGKLLLSAKQHCNSLVNSLKPIKFQIGARVLVIDPKGYLMVSSKRHKNQCFIGIESIPDNLNQYRFGNIFLENFVTFLDYDKKEISLAGNIVDSQNDGPKNQTTEEIQTDSSILDKIIGNKYSQQSRLFDFRLDNNTYKMLSKAAKTIPLYAEFSMDLFAGILAGNFPYYSPEVHAANVQDLKIQASVNLTTNIKFQIFNLVKVDLEVEFVPLLVGVGASESTTSLLEDNCFWFYFEMNTLAIFTRLRKNIATCEGNLRNVLGEMESWDKLLDFGTLLRDDLFQCHFDNELGENTQSINFLSDSLLPDFNFQRVGMQTCANKLPDLSGFRPVEYELPYDEDYDRNE